MNGKPTVLFLCPHGAAKSIIAAAYCQRAAGQHGLSLRATSAGTEPEPEVSPAVLAALRAEGLDVSEDRPRRVRRKELEAAWRVVSMGCDLEGLLPSHGRVDRWDDVPSPSQALPAACSAIRSRVERLLQELLEGPGTGPASTAKVLVAQQIAARRER